MLPSRLRGPASVARAPTAEAGEHNPPLTETRRAVPCRAITLCMCIGGSVYIPYAYTCIQCVIRRIVPKVQWLTRVSLSLFELLAEFIYVYINR